MAHLTKAYIGIGSNLANPVQQVRTAWQELQEIPHTKGIVCSALYCSAPLGPSDQPDYVNAVALLQTQMTALALLEAMQALEHTHQRIRAQHWGPRTLDLDLLLFGEHRLQTPRLTVPHPELAARRFVLQPLAEIAPDLYIPGRGPVQHLLAACVQPPLRLIR